jgi:thiamine kinase-like enzyme
MKSIEIVCEKFDIKTPLKSVNTLNSGHINDTILVTQSDNTQFIVQKLNGHVFKNVKSLIANKVYVSNHLKQYYESINSDYKTITFLKTHDGLYYYQLNNDYWNIMEFIPDCKTIEIANNSQLAYEAGKLYGNFIASTSSLKTDSVTETLKDFHSVPLRFSQFEEALKQASTKRKLNSQKYIDFVYQHKDDMFRLSEFKDNNSFPIRTTHNDAKLSNILFNEKNKGLAVIDLDTVMPGIVHFDFGDSVRSICSNATEDEIDKNKISINLEFYKAFCEGHASETTTILTQKEKLYLPLAIKTIIFIMGLRFLTDYLNNDVYYKTTYQNHNIDRAINQFTLLQSVLDNYKIINTITKEAFK